MLGDQYDTLVGQLQRQVESGKGVSAQEARAAHQRAQNDPNVEGRPELLWKETVAYMAESGANTPLMKRIVAAIRNFLRQNFGIVKNFTAADVAHLARGSVQRIADGIEGQQGTAYLEAQLYSRNSDWGGRVTPPDNTFESAAQALIDRGDGYVEGALSHPQISGAIDLVWGREGTPERNFDDGFGLAKIIRKHPEIDPTQIQDLLYESQVVPAPREERRNRIKLESEGQQFVISQEWRGDRARWLLTAYGKEGEAPPGRSVFVAGRTDPEHPSGQEASSAAPQGRSVGVAEGTASERPSGQEAADTATVPPDTDACHPPGVDLRAAPRQDY